MCYLTLDRERYDLTVLLLKRLSGESRVKLA